MANVKFYKGVEANLPTSGMVEDGAFYMCTDTGNMYLGSGTTTLIPLNHIPSASGNRADSKGVSAAAQGQINTSKLAITQYSSTVTDNTVMATMQYNETDAAIDFIFA